MDVKNFKTIDEQLNILRKRGLTIDDEEKADGYYIRNRNIYCIMWGR